MIIQHVVQKLLPFKCCIIRGSRCRLMISQAIHTKSRLLLTDNQLNAFRAYTSSNSVKTRIFWKLYRKISFNMKMHSFNHKTVALFQTMSFQCFISRYDFNLSAQNSFIDTWWVDWSWYSLNKSYLPGTHHLLNILSLLCLWAHRSLF